MTSDAFSHLIRLRREVGSNLEMPSGACRGVAAQVEKKHTGKNMKYITVDGEHAIQVYFVLDG